MFETSATALCGTTGKNYNEDMPATPNERG